MKKTWLTFELWVVVLTGLWMFLIPFGKGEKIPVMMLALFGLFKLIQTRGAITKTIASKTFLFWVALYLVPILLSMPDAPSIHNPLKVFCTGCGSALAGLAVIHACTTRHVLERITWILASVIGFWIFDAAVQAVFHVDLFGLSWEMGRLSGPFLKKTQMGYYSGPFSAILLMFTLQKNWKPVWQWGLFLFTSIIVVLNNSRGGWIMYAVVSAVFIWKTLIAPRKHKIAFCSVTALLGAVLLTGLYTTSATFQARADQSLMALRGGKQNIDQALTYRLQLWEAAWGVISDHPINGVGARNFRITGEAYWPDDYDDTDINTSYPHQFIMEYWLGTGLIGLAGWFITAGLCVYRWYRASPDQKNVALGYGVTLLALYFPLNTHKAYYSSEMSISIWILLALYSAAILQISDEPQGTRTRSAGETS